MTTRDYAHEPVGLAPALGRHEGIRVSHDQKAFQITTNGAFMERRGAGWNEERRFCQRKLCFVATDQALLAEVLGRLAERPDCFYVKYSVRPRDGMYLGRCFMVDEQEVGGLWAQYKTHPRMMCSVQDDDFTRPFRTIT
jgi:hypothetical protein